MTDGQSHAGGCHCGNIRIRLRTAIAPEDFAARVCTCTFCVKHGGRYLSDPDGALIVECQDPAQVSRYQFGHRTADFLVCGRCGVFPAVLSEIDGTTYAVVNINSLDERARFTGEGQDFDYDPETPDDRLARRQQRWIGQVSVNG
ncbi:MAG: hypothetical protein QF578_09035 [Alphaproteobacteria bacterium]|jgi:hypothetical protein|nr:hypothetical protein [Alphaproteobacteria bacterium]MDP6564955.1 hypothetical protein [Alphaproteobacteria bacterium]MDP6811820.1 hypothetical protein [Alphaproteobacteria bacterium]